MPIYEYVCGSCGNAFELLVASSRVKGACPQCGSKKLEKQFSAFAAHQGSSAAGPCSAGGCPAGAPAGGCGGGACPFA